jgi:hypothetical protein
MMWVIIFAPPTATYTDPVTTEKSFPQGKKKPYVRT